MSDALLFVAGVAFVAIVLLGVALVGVLHNLTMELRMVRIGLAEGQTHLAALRGALVEMTRIIRPPLQLQIQTPAPAPSSDEQLREAKPTTPSRH